RCDLGLCGSTNGTGGEALHSPPAPRALDLPRPAQPRLQLLVLQWYRLAHHDGCFERRRCAFPYGWLCACNQKRGTRDETLMAINLKKTNVVIIGAGAAGGVAALPLAQAGIEVIALEAGGWVSPRDMAPDELRYTRGWPAKLQKVNDEIPTHRATASSPMTPRPERHAMMNAVGGTSV